MKTIRNLLAALALSVALMGTAASADAQMRAEATESVERIDLNSASVDELIALPGIGAAKAEAIVRYRDNRPFRRVEDLVRVRGIGRALYRNLRDRVTVNEAPRRRGRR
ncbi:MAG: ComEA family DNA-binding protein [Myxococcota bacterium]